MDEIKAGDLVMVIRPTLCCDEPGTVGKIYKVSGVGHGHHRCMRCGHITVYADYADTGEVVGSKQIAHQLKRLKKIDPPATGDEVSTRTARPVPVEAVQQEKV